MKPIRLEDLKPEAAKFYLRSMGKEYTLRPVTLEDEKWLRTTFKDDLQRIFSEQKSYEICQIIWRLLSEEDKGDFKQIEVKGYDEEGCETVTKLGGVDRLMSCVHGYAEKILIFRALLQTIGISRPMQDELAKEEAEAEKKRQEQETSPSAGDPSLTSSPPNTDGPTTKSGSSHQESSALLSEKSTSESITVSP